jgi:hypothetical protein
MEREQALQTLHEQLPPDVGFSVRCATTTHTVEDFFKSPPTRTGEYRNVEQWTVTLQCRRGEQHYLESTSAVTLAAVVADSMEQFRGWERQLSAKPPKQVAPSRAAGAEQVEQREAM